MVWKLEDCVLEDLLCGVGYAVLDGLGVERAK
jgi:hypothetical protein